MKLFVAVFFVLTFVVSAQLMADWNYDRSDYKDPDYLAVSLSPNEKTVDTSRVSRFIRHSHITTWFNRGILSLIAEFWAKKLKKHPSWQSQQVQQESAQVSASTSQRLEETAKTVENLKGQLESLTSRFNAYSCHCDADVSASIGKIPSSCAELRAVGYSKSGLYSVLGTQQVEKVYCDFTQPSNGPNFQKFIGYEDVKSTPVYFYVQKDTPFSTVGTQIPFEVEVVNTGNAMDAATGIFTAPVKGTYFFTFTGHAHFQGGAFSVLETLSVNLYLNGNVIGTSSVGETHDLPNQPSLVTLQSTLNLAAGDQVWMQIQSLTAGVTLYDDSNHLTHFNGFLLEQDFS